MKKLLSLLLALILILSTVALVSCGKTEETPADGTETEENVLSEEEQAKLDEKGTDTEAHAPGSSYKYAREKLTVNGTPTWSDGKLTVCFNEIASFNEVADVFIGVIQPGEAASYAATIDMTATANFAVDGGYNGIVLIPNETIPAGEYDISVTVGTCIVDTFTLTID